MKKLIIIFLIVCSSYFLVSQTVTNNGVDLEFGTNIDNSLRISWKNDENLRTNGIAPYTSNMTALTYKQYLGLNFGTSGSVVDGTVSQLQEVALFEKIRSLRNTDPSLYRKIFRLAYGLPN